MGSAGDEDETQALDIDSPPSGTQFEDPIDNDRDDGMGQDHITAPFCETLLLDSLIGETQALDDPDCVSLGVQGEIDAWGKTQLLDEYEETEAAGDDDDDDVDDDENDDGTVRTELLSDDEGLQNDDVTSSGVGVRRDERPEERPTGHEQCPADQGEKEVVVDSDASTDEERGGGDHESSASLLSGGSHHSNHGAARKSFTAVRAASLRCSGLAAARNTTSKKQDTAVGVQTSTKATGTEGRINSTVDPTSLDTTSGVDNVHTIENSNWCTLDYHRDETKSRINNTRIRKLFNEVSPPRSEETASKAENVGGLSYVESQEPGDLSQSNALGVVDKFLFVNDVGSSQEFKTGKTVIVKSPPISSTKGAQSLAKKADRRSLVGKEGIYDWIDSLEDEGGGEFFSRKKYAFFESRGGLRKARSQPPKGRRGETEGLNAKTHLIPRSLTRSDSRLMLHNAPGNKKVHNSETKTKKNLFKNMDDPLDSKSRELQLGGGGVDGGGEGVYDVGPDTQMAAEAMEALIHGSPVNHQMKDSHRGARKVTENSSKGVKKKRNSSKNALIRKRTASPESEGIVTRSKRRKMLSGKSRRGKRKVEENLNARSSVNENGSSRSLNRDREMAQGTVDEGFTADADNRLSSLTPKDQVSVSKEVILGVHHINTTPVAHRTRHSRAVQAVEVEKNITIQTEAHDIGELCEEEPTTGSLIKDSLSHPKRRRTSQIILGSPTTNGNLNNPSVSVDNVPATTVQASAQGGKTKIFVRSVSEILATAKRKKRSISTQKASKGDDTISGVRTRSSVNSDQRVVHKDVELANKDVDSTSYLNDAEENPKLDGSPKEKVQRSDLPCTTPSKAIDAVSPVVMGLDPPRTPSNKSFLRSSVVRELIRLEAFESSHIWMPKDLRRRKDMASVRVLFSHHLDEDTIKQQKKILARLGVPVASSMSDATHFVTDKFVRTRNMLEAMALGKPVVTPMWLESCGQASCFIDEKNYILRDSKKEKDIGFSMPVSLAHACRCPFLQGRRVFITPNTKPDRELLASLVKAAHGQPLERIGRSATKDDKVPDDLLVISCEEDYPICKPLLEKGTEVFSSELLLNGIVIQKLEYERHRLFSDHVKRTRSTLWLRRDNGDRFLPVTKCT